MFSSMIEKTLVIRCIRSSISCCTNTVEQKQKCQYNKTANQCDCCVLAQKALQCLINLKRAFSHSLRFDQVTSYNEAIFKYCPFCLVHLCPGSSYRTWPTVHSGKKRRQQNAYALHDMFLTKLATDNKFISFSIYRSPWIPWQKRILWRPPQRIQRTPSANYTLGIPIAVSKQTNISKVWCQ
jgi:hypothetical protein